jgi:hypothetical protein
VAEASKNKINKCGELVRRVMFEGELVSVEELDEAVRVIHDFRAAHAYPLLKVRNGLTSMVRTECADDVIGQRLKRVPRIIRKLQRTVGSPTGRTMLARLDDIGGVRAMTPMHRPASRRPQRHRFSRRDEEARFLSVNVARHPLTKRR